MKARSFIIPTMVMVAGAGAVPFLTQLKQLNEEACKEAAECGHHMECTTLWMACNLKLLRAEQPTSGDGRFHPDLGYMIPWWYQGF
ncbi:hypothetical protein F5Y15DRAFT_346302 [Xylariaceae sp. FL0016]|nr:hypothetical protein F5Y15DRAFT_346302 [Xylariaceae sp. FL0016]